MQYVLVTKSGVELTPRFDDWMQVFSSMDSLVTTGWLHNRFEIVEVGN